MGIEYTIPGIKAGVKVTEALKTIASLSRVITLILAENIKYKTKETAKGLNRLGSEVFENLVDLKEDGLDVVSIIAFTSGITSAIIDYSENNIKKEEDDDSGLNFNPRK